jgi:hypothetical protein
VHGLAAAPSSAHSNVPASLEEKVNSADVLLTVPVGPVSINVAGGVVSGPPPPAPIWRGSKNGSIKRAGLNALAIACQEAYL